jgi:hypothetical protein
MKQFSRISKVVLLLLALGLPAVAGKPIIVVNPFTPFVITAAEGCGTFDVYFAPEAGRPNGGRVIVFANAEIWQGPVFATATNVSTGKSINLNLSGPTHVSFTTNTTVVYEGPGLTLLTADLAAAAGLPVVASVTGRTVFGLDAQGNVISVSFTGTAQDLCQLLQ